MLNNLFKDTVPSSTDSVPSSSNAYHSDDSIDFIVERTNDGHINDGDSENINCIIIDDDLAESFNVSTSEMIEQVNHLDDVDDDMSDLKLEETDEEMLRQVHDLDKRFNCRVCGKKFARKLYKTFHEQHCNGEDRGTVCRPAKQFKIDDFLTKKPATIERETIQSGYGDDHGEEWQTPKLVQFAVNKVAVSYRKEFDHNKQTDLFDRLKRVMGTFHDTIHAEKARKKTIKYYFTLKLVFHKNKNIEELTDPPISFRSKVFTLLDKNTNDVDDNSLNAYQQFVNQIEEFQRNGSDWVLDHFICLDLGSYSSIKKFVLIFIGLNVQNSYSFCLYF